MNYVPSTFIQFFLKAQKKFKSLLKKIKFDCLKFREFLILEIFFQNPFMLNNPPPTNINLETSCPNLGHIFPHPGRICPNPGRISDSKAAPGLIRPLLYRVTVI